MISDRCTCAFESSLCPFLTRYQALDSAMLRWTACVSALIDGDHEEYANLQLRQVPEDLQVLFVDAESILIAFCCLVVIVVCSAQQPAANRLLAYQ